MKAMYFIVAALSMLSLASCSAIEDNLALEKASIYTLVDAYGATALVAEPQQSSDLLLSDLPSVTVEEAHAILSDIRKHESSQKDTRTVEEQKSNKILLKVEMSEVISGKYSFFLQLNLMKYTDNSLFYNGYEANCKSGVFKWYRKGFNFSCDNSQSGCYKFETPGYLYFKVIDKGVQYLQVPFKVMGTYDTAMQEVNFSYSL